MNITLTGNLGSGKGSVSEIFKQKGFGYISGGDIFRGVAQEKGISVVEMNKLAEKDRSYDDLVDARSTRLGDELDNTLFDSRLAWHFVRESFKVFLLVDTDESARRVFSGPSRKMEDYSSMEECADSLTIRANLERERFRGLYDIDYYAKDNYDLVIESTNASPQEIADEIERQFEEYKLNKYATRVLLNSKAVYPMRDLTEAELSDVAEAKNIPSVGTADEPVRVISCGGYNYIDGDGAAVLKATASGKSFIRVESFRKEEEIDTALTETGIQAIQEKAGFVYRSNPAKNKVKHEYMMDLSC